MAQGFPNQSRLPRTSETLALSCETAFNCLLPMGTTFTVTLSHILHIPIRSHVQGSAHIGHFHACAGRIECGQSNVHRAHDDAGDERHILHPAHFGIEERVDPNAGVWASLNGEDCSLNVLPRLGIQKFGIPVLRRPSIVPPLGQREELRDAKARGQQSGSYCSRGPWRRVYGCSFALLQSMAIRGMESQAVDTSELLNLLQGLRRER